MTRALPGQDATAEHLRADPARLVPLLARGLRRFHAAPFAACPFDFTLDAAIAHARARVAGGLVDPAQDLHPELLIAGDEVSGFVDLGELGVADRWWDLAVGSWSITWNLGPGWEERFLGAYGVTRDERRIAFFRLLYDLVS